ncbi:MAG: helix-turn-helix domain-containing protein [Gemmatimonadota bacterium]
MTDYRRACCSSFHRAVELVGRRWTGVLLYVLAEGPTRFVEITARLPDITPRMLTERLRELELEGIVERSVLPESPPRVEYSLTRKGRELTKALQGIATWAKRWIPSDSCVGEHSIPRD